MISGGTFWPLLTAGVIFGLTFTTGRAQSVRYQLVADWPKLPTGVYFGTKGGLPKSPDTTRAAKARSQGVDPTPAKQGDPDEGLGVSGLAIDSQDRIYLFNRGKKPVMILDSQGILLASGGDQEMNGRKIKMADLHSGGVDWDGNVYVVDRGNERIVKLDRKLELVMQIGTSGVAGTGPSHFNRPSGVAILRNGNIVVTDGYENSRLVMFDKDGGFIRQVSKGGGSPSERGTKPGEWHLPHKVALDSNDNIYAVDRENYRIQVFDKDLRYLRGISIPDWNPWDIAISRSGDDTVAFLPDHTSEQVMKISLKDGRILSRWGKAGRSPGEFDWVHGVVVDSRGAVYVCDSYGQQVQKFVPEISGRISKAQ